MVLFKIGSLLELRSLICKTFLWMSWFLGNFIRQMFPTKIWWDTGVCCIYKEEIVHNFWNLFIMLLLSFLLQHEDG